MSETMFDPVEFGARTLAAMGDRTCRDVAPEIGVSRSTLNRVTRGLMPTVLVYLAICRWLWRAQAEGGEVEQVARAMAGDNWLPFDPKIHGSPVNQSAAQRMWLEKARLAIDAVRALPTLTTETSNG